MNSFKISSLSSAPSWLSLVCVLPLFTPSSKFCTSSSEAVTLIASESLRDFMQGLSASSSAEKLSLRCRLLPDSLVPVGSRETVSRASREHSPVGMRWHNCHKKVDILSMQALSWSSAFSSFSWYPSCQLLMVMVKYLHSAFSIGIFKCALQASDQRVR